MIKRISLIAAMAVSISATAQISFAAKANALLPAQSPTWQNLKSATTAAVLEEGKSVAGFNVGISARIDVPASLFVMPEIYYTHFGNTYTPSGSNTELKINYNRIDIPVLVGYRILGKQLGAFIGPVGSFNVSNEESIAQFKNMNSIKNFSFGYQIGAEARWSKLIVNARYEGAFSSDQRKFINSTSGQTLTYDNRPSHFLVGLGYEF